MKTIPGRYYQFGFISLCFLWDRSITQIKVLRYEKNKMAQYYLVYDLPWPVTDRDLCVDVKVTIDYVDPAGSIPDWLSNMLIVDSPLDVNNGVKQRLEK